MKLLISSKIILVLCFCLMSLTIVAQAGSSIPSCCIGMRGNINGDFEDDIDISDLTYLVDFMFKGGPAPPCYEEADLDRSGSIDISDLTFLVDYMFKGGPPPEDCD